MKKLLTTVMVIGFVAALASAALAFGPGGPGRGFGGYGPGYMMGGYGGYGPGGMMGGWGGANGGWGCPGWAAASGVSQQAVTEDQAKAAASDYAAKYFPGYSIERVLPFSGGFRTMYQVEMKGPKGQSRVLYVNPWGQVRPGAPGTAGE